MGSLEPKLSSCRQQRLWSDLADTTWQKQQNECASSEDSDQPGHPPSLIKVFACAQWVAKNPSFLHEDSKDSDQTGRMPRNLSLRWVHSFCWFCHVAAQIRKSCWEYRESVIWAATSQNQQSDCAPSEDSVFAVRMKKAWVLSYPLSAQQRLWSDRSDAQADLSLRWTHTDFVVFVMLRLIFSNHADKCKTRKLYTYIKHKCTENSGIAPLKSDGSKYTAPTQQATVLNKQPESIFSKPKALSLKFLAELELWFSRIKSQIYLRKMPEISIIIKGTERLLKSSIPTKPQAEMKFPPDF